MNIYLINVPDKLYIKDSRLFISSKSEEQSVKISDIENIIVFNDHKLPEDVAGKLEKQSIYYIDNQGRIKHYKPPNIKLKQIKNKYSILYVSALRTVKSIWSYSKIDGTIKFGIELDLIRLGKDIGFVDENILNNQSNTNFQAFLSSLIYRTNYLFKFGNLFSGIDILHIEKTKSHLQSYNLLFSLLTVFINHHLIKTRINPLQEIVLKRKTFEIIDEEKFGSQNYPDATIVLMFPFCIAVYDLIKNLEISSATPGYSKNKALVMIKHFNLRFTYNYGNVNKLTDMIQQITQL